MIQRIRVVAVGKLREAYWRDAEAEYRKRLSGYTTKLEVIEVADEPTPDNASPAQEDAARRREAERILARLSDREHVIALDGTGRAFSSPAFAAHLQELGAQGGVSDVAFVIGGSLGLHDTARVRADLLLSFGAFTFPHQMMRTILLEQLYRAYKIAKGEPYHK